MLNHLPSFEKVLFCFQWLINTLNSLYMGVFFLTETLVNTYTFLEIIFPQDALVWDFVLFVLYISKTKLILSMFRDVVSWASQYSSYVLECLWGFMLKMQLHQLVWHQNLVVWVRVQLLCITVSWPGLRKSTSYTVNIAFNVKTCWIYGCSLVMYFFWLILVVARLVLYLRIIWKRKSYWV